MVKCVPKEVDALFIIPPYHQRNGSSLLFPLGISAIIAYLETKGVTWDYVDCTRIIHTLKDDCLKRLKSELGEILPHYRPRLVGIGPCVTPAAKGLEVVAECCFDAFGKEIVFAGGPFALLPSQEWFFYEHLGLKYLIRGDGEEAVYSAVSTVKSGRSLYECAMVAHPGYPQVNYVKKLDDLPYPKRIQVEENKLSDRRKPDETGISAHIVASRGCPYQCRYCVSGSLKLIPFRKRTVNSIVSEMKYLIEKHHVTDIVFYDDCFFTGRATVHHEIQEFCKAVKDAGLNVTWQIEIRPDILIEITDEELRLLSACGCRQMNIGIEKVGYAGAAEFGKQYSFEKLKRYLEHIRAVCPIKTTGTFILGGKGETEESVRELIQTSTRLNLDSAEYSPLFVYPDTPIYDEVFDNPRAWFEIVRDEEESWGEVVYESRELTKEKLKQMVDEAYLTFYKDKKHLDADHIKDRYRLKG